MTAHVHGHAASFWTTGGRWGIHAVSCRCGWSSGFQWESRAQARGDYLAHLDAVRRKPLLVGILPAIYSALSRSEGGAR